MSEEGDMIIMASAYIAVTLAILLAASVLIDTDNYKLKPVCEECGK